MKLFKVATGLFLVIFGACQVLAGLETLISMFHAIGLNPLMDKEAIKILSFFIAFFVCNGAMELAVGIYLMSEVKK